MKTWEGSELSKRVQAVEEFAILHGFNQWHKQTIPEFLKENYIEKEALVSLFREYRDKYPDANFDDAIGIILGICSSK